MVNTRN
jgi:hypothetical protein